MEALDPKKTLGVLADSFSSAFVGQAMLGIEKGLEGSGLAVKFIEIDAFSAAERFARVDAIAAEREVAALMYVHMTLNPAQVLRFKEKGIPLGYLAGRLEGAHWCMVDEEQGGYLAARHLLGLGHHRIAQVSGPLVAMESRLREDGFLRALREKGLQFERERDLKILNFSQGEGYEAGNLLLDLPAAERPTAIFVSAGDQCALGVLEAAKERGLRVPEDLSVVGYDDLHFAARLEPPLTTVRQPIRAMAERLAQSLAGALLQSPVQRRLAEVLDPELVVRASTAAAPRP